MVRAGSSTRLNRKSANVVGGVMAIHHPHEVRGLSTRWSGWHQDFSLRHPLVDPHGNFGSIDVTTGSGR